jgi:hypothetical protein
MGRVDGIENYHNYDEAVTIACQKWWLDHTTSTVEGYS